MIQDQFEMHIGSMSNFLSVSQDLFFGGVARVGGLGPKHVHGNKCNARGYLPNEGPLGWA